MLGSSLPISSIVVVDPFGKSVFGCFGSKAIVCLEIIATFAIPRRGPLLVGVRVLLPHVPSLPLDVGLIPRRANVRALCMLLNGVPSLISVDPLRCASM